MCAFVKSREEIGAQFRPVNPIQKLIDSNPVTNEQSRQNLMIALDLGSLLIPGLGALGTGAKAVRGAAKTASVYKGTRAVKNAAKARKDAARAAKVASRGGSIRREEFYGQRALNRGYKARDQFADMETYERLARQANSLAKAIERFPAMRKEYVRLRAAYNVGQIGTRAGAVKASNSRRKG